MKIEVYVKTNARRDTVAAWDDGSLLISVNAPPVGGRANQKLIELLAEYYHKPKSSITIVRGTTSKRKIVEVQ